MSLVGTRPPTLDGVFYGLASFLFLKKFTKVIKNKK